MVIIIIKWNNNASHQFLPWHYSQGFPVFRAIHLNYPHSLKLRRPDNSKDLLGELALSSGSSGQSFVFIPRF